MKGFFLFFTETLLRLKSKSPSYFNKLKYLSAGLAAVGVYLKANNIDFEIHKISIVTLCIGAGAVGTFLSSLPMTTADQPKLDELKQPTVPPTSN